MKKNILVVDDEEDIRMTISAALEKNGYGVTQAIDGQDCINQVSKEKPDLILLDVMMPGIPAKEIMKKIDDVKIVFVSVVRKAESKENGLLDQDNIVDYVEKPFDMFSLLEKVKIILDR